MNTLNFAIIGAVVMVGITGILSSIGMKNIMAASEGAISAVNRARKSGENKDLEAPGNWSTIIPGLPMSQILYAFITGFFFILKIGNGANWTMEFIWIGIFGGLGMGFSSWAQSLTGASALKRLSEQYIASNGEENPSVLVKMGFPELFAILTLAICLLALFL